jgi:hypothetical protein
MARTFAFFEKPFQTQKSDRAGEVESSPDVVIERSVFKERMLVGLSRRDWRHAAAC